MKPHFFNYVSFPFYNHFNNSYEIYLQYSCLYSITQQYCIKGMFVELVEYVCYLRYLYWVYNGTRLRNLSLIDFKYLILLSWSLVSRQSVTTPLGSFRKNFECNKVDVTIKSTLKINIYFYKSFRKHIYIYTIFLRSKSIKTVQIYIF